MSGRPGSSTAGTVAPVDNHDMRELDDKWTMACLVQGELRDDCLRGLRLAWVNVVLQPRVPEGNRQSDYSNRVIFRPPPHSCKLAIPSTSNEGKIRRVHHRQATSLLTQLSVTINIR